MICTWLHMGLPTKQLQQVASDDEVPMKHEQEEQERETADLAQVYLISNMT